DQLELVHDTFWDRRSCRGHFFDGTPWCYNCDRFQQAGDQYLDLGDGRLACSDCSSITIMDPKDFKPLIEMVHKFYRSLNLKLVENISVFLADRHEIHKLCISKGKYRRLTLK
ncbi:protein DA1-like, partial [Rosa sericea]